MDVKGFFGSISICFLVLGLAGFNPLGQIRPNEPVNAGGELEVHVNLNNHLHHSLDNVRIRGYMPELDAFAYGSSLDVGRHKKTGSWLYWDIPEDTPKGDYLVRVVASGDGFRDVDYTWASIY